MDFQKRFLFIFWNFLFLFLFSTFCSPQFCNSERESLVQFYKETSLYSRWSNSDGWLVAGTDHCQWFGVQCALKEGQIHVVKLLLSSNQMTGPLPEILGNLLFLEEMDLSNNNFEGVVPETLNRLKNLKSLNVSENKLSSFSETLDLVSLKVMSLSNNLFGSLPLNFANWTQLKVVEASSIGLNELKQPLKSVSSLEVLKLNFNPSLKVDKEVWGLKNLRILELERTSLFDNSIDFSSVPQLQVFNGASNEFTSIPDFLFENENFEVLFLQHNQIETVTNKKKWKNLKEFKCSNCDMKSFQIEAPNLEVLDLSSNNQMEKLNVSQMKNLKEFKYSCFKLIPSSLSEMTQLKVLNIEGKQTMIPIDFPPSLEVLLFLNMKKQVFDQPFLNGSFVSLYDLVFQVSFEENHYPIFLPKIEFNSKEFPSLQKIHFYGTWKGSFQSEIGSLSSLRYLWLSETHLEGSFPTQVGQLSQLESLILSGNKYLKGSIPTELSQLTNLQSLNIEKNSFDNNKLPLNLKLFNNQLKVCSLNNNPQFYCESDGLSGDNVCNVICQGKSIVGKWMNVFEGKCVPNSFGIDLMRTMIEFFSNDSFVLVSDFSLDCNSPSFSTKVLGFYELVELNETSSDVFSFKMKFIRESSFAMFWSDNIRDAFYFMCGWTFDVGQWSLDPRKPCPIEDFGLSFTWPSKNECTMFFEIGKLDFKTNSLWFGWIPLEYHFTNCYELPSNLSSLVLRRSWECERETFLETCTPECGDGVVFGGESCDPVKTNDGCLQCQKQEGWECTQQQCSSICGDGIVVDNLDCDQKTFGSSESEMIWIVSSVLGGIVFILIVIVIVVRKRTQNKRSTFLISENELERHETLGEGAFGRVYKAIWKGTTEVAVKEIKSERVTSDLLEEFKKEAKFYSQLPPHPNILQFLGIIVPSKNLKNIKNGHVETTENTDKVFQIVTEYLVEGNMISFMEKYRDGIPPDQPPNEEEYLLMIELAMGIAAGMHHLHSHGIAHRDLAARNVLIHTKFKSTNPKNSQNGSISVVPKISDFGLTVSVQKNRPIPVRWAPPEAFIFGETTKEGDIWSFGVVLFEITEFCLTPPFSLLKNSEVREKVISGGHLEPSPNSPILFRSLILSCFSRIPSLRPKFSILFESLKVEYNSLLMNIDHEREDIIDKKDKQVRTVFEMIPYENITKPELDVPNDKEIYYNN